MRTIIQVGHDDASDRYIRSKTRAIEKAGLEAEVINLPEDCKECDVREIIETSDSTAIMVQLPLPAHLDKYDILDSIPPEKDIDGLTLHSDYTPLTPSAIMRWFHEQQVDLVGKHVVVFGRSELVGRPLAESLIAHGATVSVLNSKTSKHLAETICTSADIIVSAVGKPNTITYGIVKQACNLSIVVDVGINRDDNGTLCGDVSAEAKAFVKAHGGFCTPVPGGVGKWTVQELIERLKEMENSCGGM